MTSVVDGGAAALLLAARRGDQNAPGEHLDQLPSDFSAGQEPLADDMAVSDNRR